MPSIWEGFGLVATEMLSTGLSLISTKVSGHTEVIGDCPAAQLVEPNNPKALANGILKAVKHIKKVGIKKSAIQAKRQSEMFSMDLMINNYQKLYLKTYKKFGENQK